MNKAYVLDATAALGADFVRALALAQTAAPTETGTPSAATSTAPTATTAAPAATDATTLSSGSKKSAEKKPAKEEDDAAAGDRSFGRQRHRPGALSRLSAEAVPAVHPVR